MEFTVGFVVSVELMDQGLAAVPYVQVWDERCGFGHITLLAALNLND